MYKFSSFHHTHISFLFMPFYDFANRVEQDQKATVDQVLLCLLNWCECFHLCTFGFWQYNYAFLWLCKQSRTRSGGYWCSGSTLFAELMWMLSSMHLWLFGRIIMSLYPDSVSIIIYFYINVYDGKKFKLCKYCKYCKYSCLRATREISLCN